MVLVFFVALIVVGFLVGRSRGARRPRFRVRRLTPHQVALIAAITAITRQLMLVGPRERIRQAGVTRLMALRYEGLGGDTARALIDAGIVRQIPAAGFDVATRHWLMQVAVHIGSGAGRPSAAMVTALDRIAVELGFTPDLVRRMAGIGPDPTDARARAEADARARQEADARARAQGREHTNGGRERSVAGRAPSVAAASKYLGLSPDASAAQLKARYRVLMRKYHPDRAAAAGIDVAEATKKAQRINAAYEVLLATHPSGV